MAKRLQSQGLLLSVVCKITDSRSLTVVCRLDTIWLAGYNLEPEPLLNFDHGIHPKIQIDAFQAVIILGLLNTGPPVVEYYPVETGLEVLGL